MELKRAEFFKIPWVGSIVRIRPFKSPKGMPVCGLFHLRRRNFELWISSSTQWHLHFGNVYGSLLEMLFPSSGQVSPAVLVGPGCTWNPIVYCWDTEVSNVEYCLYKHYISRSFTTYPSHPSQWNKLQGSSLWHFAAEIMSNKAFYGQNKPCLWY